MEENHFIPNTPDKLVEKPSKSGKENKSRDGNVEAEEKSTKKTAENCFLCSDENLVNHIKNNKPQK